MKTVLNKLWYRALILILFLCVSLLFVRAISEIICLWNNTFPPIFSEICLWSNWPRQKCINKCDKPQKHSLMGIALILSQLIITFQRAAEKMRNTLWFLSEFHVSSISDEVWSGLDIELIKALTIWSGNNSCSIGRFNQAFKLFQIANACSSLSQFTLIQYNTRKIPLKVDSFICRSVLIHRENSNFDW